MPHQPIAVLNTQPDIHYIHSDHLNTPQRITNTAQQTVWAADYQPFGQATLTTASITNPLRFPGQYYDEETNLHYNYFRGYDPTTGRYIQSDPIGLAGGLNTYGYVGGESVAIHGSSRSSNNGRMGWYQRVKCQRKLYRTNCPP